MILLNGGDEWALEAALTFMRLVPAFVNTITVIDVEVKHLSLDL